MSFLKILFYVQYICESDVWLQFRKTKEGGKKGKRRHFLSDTTIIQGRHEKQCKVSLRCSTFSMVYFISYYISLVIMIVCRRNVIYHFLPLFFRSLPLYYFLCLVCSCSSVRNFTHEQGGKTNVPRLIIQPKKRKEKRKREPNQKPTTNKKK